MIMSAAPTTNVALPGPLGRFAAATAANLQVPLEIPTLLGLGALSAASRGRWQVRVADGWTEPLALYVAALAESGARKSAALTRVWAPLVAREAELREAGRDELLRRQVHHEVDQLRARDALESATTDEQRAAAAERLAELDRTQPQPLRLWCEHVTGPALAEILATPGDARALVSDGHALRDLATGPDLGLLLGAYDGGRVRLDRASKPSLDIREPFLAVLAVDTPDLPARIDRRRSLLERFLFAVPEVAFGSRQVPEPAVPAEVTAQWDRTLRALLDAALAAQAVTELTLAPDAAEEFAAFVETGRLGLDLAEIPSWAAKHPGRTARIAALLALAENPGHTEVGVEHMRAAVALAEPLAEHARLALGAVAR